MSDDAFVCYSSCFWCHREIVVEYDDDNFQTEENVTFLGRLGKETYSYCPYCGKKESGFIPYDANQPIKIDHGEGNIPDEDDEEDFWWPEAEGVELIDDETEDDSAEELDDDSARVLFICPACKERFRMNPKGRNKIYCYYCGKEAKTGE